MVAARRLARKPPPQATDERLLVEAARADLSKFDALYELHFARLYLFIVGRVHNRATAEDLTSEVFHRALANLSTYEWRGTSFAAWLYRIASNAIADQYKRANRERSGNADTLGSLGQTFTQKKRSLSTAEPSCFASSRNFPKFNARWYANVSLKSAVLKKSPNV